MLFLTPEINCISFLYPQICYQKSLLHRIFLRTFLVNVNGPFVTRVRPAWKLCCSKWKLGGSKCTILGVKEKSDCTKHLASTRMLFIINSSDKTICFRAKGGQIIRVLVYKNFPDSSGTLHDVREFSKALFVKWFCEWQHTIPVQ